MTIEFSFPTQDRPRSARLMVKSMIRSAELAVGRWQITTINKALCYLGGLQPCIADIHHPVRSIRLSVPCLYRTPLTGPRPGSTPQFDSCSRPPIVLIHGFGDSKEVWLPTIIAMSRRWPLLLVDLPGFGAATTIPPELATLERQASVLQRLLQDMNISRAHLVGFSMGGGVALHLAERSAQLVSSLALVSSVGPYVTDSDLSRCLERGTNPLIPRSASESKEMFKFFMNRTYMLPRAAMRHLSAERLALADRLQAIFDYLVPDLTAQTEEQFPLRRITAPCLVISGNKDRIIHPDTSRALARGIPRAKLVELPNVGHAIPVEASWRVARALEDFIVSTERDSSSPTAVHNVHPVHCP